MKSESISKVHDAISAGVHGAGFKKTGSLWAREAEACKMLIEPQKSQYSDRYFINLGVHFPQFDCRQKPRTHQAHVQTRLESLLFGAERDELERALDFGDSLTGDQDRKGVVAGSVRSHAVPFLDEYSTLEGIKRAQAKGDRLSVLIRAELIPHLRRLKEGE